MIPTLRLAVVGVGVLVDAVLTAVDAAGPGAVTIGLVPIVPLFLAAVAGPWQTGLVAVVGLVLVAVSGAWDHDLGSVAYDRRVVVGVIVGALAVVLAASRERIARDRERFRLLADLAEAADGRRSLADTAGQDVAAAQSRPAPGESRWLAAQLWDVLTSRAVAGGRARRRCGAARGDRSPRCS